MDTTTDAALTLIQKISFFIVNPIIAILFGIALAFFAWGIVEYLWQNDSEEARAKGRKHMFWGIIGIFIMVSAFAIVKIIVGTIGADVPFESFNR